MSLRPVNKHFSLSDVQDARHPRELVCDFNLAREIHEQGVELKTYFYYLHMPDIGKANVYRNKTAYKYCVNHMKRGLNCRLIAAPVSEEINKLLPEMCQSWYENETRDGKMEKRWFAAFLNLKNDRRIIRSGSSECNARAKLFLYLLRHDLLPEYPD